MCEHQNICAGCFRIWIGSKVKARNLFEITSIQVGFQSFILLISIFNMDLLNINILDIKVMLSQNVLWFLGF